MMRLDGRPAWRASGWRALLGLVVAITTATDVCWSKIPVEKANQVAPEMIEGSQTGTNGWQVSDESHTQETSDDTFSAEEGGALESGAAGGAESQDLDRWTEVAENSRGNAPRLARRYAAGAGNVVVDVRSATTASDSPTAPVPVTRNRSLMSRFRSLLRRWLPSSEHPQPTQPTPVRMNRYVLLFIYWLVTASTVAPLYGWRALSGLLLSQGAYAASCPMTSGNQTDATGSGSLRTLQACTARVTAVECLFSVGCVANCAMCAIVGLFYSRLGPRATGLVGHALNLLGWMLLSLSSATVVAHLPAILLLGVAIHFNFFSVLTIRGLFPGNESSVVMLLGAAFMVSTVVPGLLRSASNLSGLSVGHTIVAYIVGVLIPAALSVACLLPSREFTTLDRTQDRSSVSEETTAAVRSQGGLEGEGEPGRDRASFIPRLQRRVYGLLASPLLSLRFMVATLYRVVCNLAAGYYQQAAGVMLSTSAANSLSYVLPTAGCVSCLAMGATAARFSNISLMLVVSMAAVLMYALPLFSSTNLAHYFSAVLAALFLACFSSQHLTLIEDLFGPADFPLVAGWSVMLSGLLGALSSILYGRLTMELLGGAWRPVSLALSALLLMQYLWLFLLWRHTRRTRHRRVEARPILDARDLASPRANTDSIESSRGDEDV